jgi:hypothetical protein
MHNAFTPPPKKNKGSSQNGYLAGDISDSVSVLSPSASGLLDSDSSFRFDAALPFAFDELSLFEASLFEASVFEASLFEASVFEASLFEASLFEASLFDASLFEASLFDLSAVGVFFELSLLLLSAGSDSSTLICGRKVDYVTIRVEGPIVMSQGCQMVCFSNQRSQFGSILEGLRLEKVEILYGHLEFFFQTST